MEAYTSDPQTRKRKIECKPELVISSLQRFYLSHPEINKVLTYLNGEAPLSLRIIDWFVTKYSRKNFVRYQLNGQDFLVYLSYKGLNLHNSSVTQLSALVSPTFLSKSMGVGRIAQKCGYRCSY